MKLCISLFAIVVLMVLASGHRDSIVGAASAPPPTMGFFLTSQKNKTATSADWLGRTAFAKPSQPPRGAETRHGEPT